jgi:Zn-dependent protease
MRWKLGRAFGIGIYVHWTFALIVGYVLFSSLSAPGQSPVDRAIHSLTFVCAAFGCVVLHELGHALTARHYGIATRDITLYPIGGVARLERMSERPAEEFWIAVAGPAVNVVIAGILLLVSWFSLNAFGSSSLSMAQLIQGNLLIELLVANIWLVLFNLLPAFPMDGGRVLRSLLAHFLGRLRATEIAAQLGVFFAILFALLGFGLVRDWGSNPLLILIGIFTFRAGQQELAFVRYQERQRQAGPLDVLPANADVVDVVPVESDEHFSGPVWDGKARAWVIWRNGRPVRVHWID